MANSFARLLDEIKMRNKTMTKNPQTPPQQDPNVLWLSVKRHPKEIGWLVPDQRKKAWVDETSFRRFKNAITPLKGGVKGGAEPDD